jgi:3-deoxy-7-phosphoheptulonate synthase
MKKVAIQGIVGSYSEEAARKIVGEKAEILCCANFALTFETLLSGRAFYAVVPLKNKIVGFIQTPLELLNNSDLRVLDEHPLEVRHVLIGTADARFENLGTVESHPEALKQCRRFFRENKQIEEIGGSDTASSRHRKPPGLRNLRRENSPGKYLRRPGKHNLVLPAGQKINKYAIIKGKRHMLDAWTRNTSNSNKNTPQSNPAFPLASRRGDQQTSIIWVKDTPIGCGSAVVIAGPCSVESREQTVSTAFAVREHGATMLRGGAYKPRTSPYDFQGLGLEALEILREAGDLTGLPVVTEVMSEEDAELVAGYADMLQVGARNMQNFALLKKLSRIERPVLLKRGPSATIKEWLSAAEYLLHGGNENVVLCERGIKTFDNSLRNTLDLAAVALVKEMSHLPVIVDPSHATGKRSLISATAKAALAVGADGVIVEVHPQPETALSDKEQQLTFHGFAEMMNELTRPLPVITRKDFELAVCR